MSPSVFDIFLFVSILVLGIATLAWIRSQQDHNDSVHKYIESVSDATDMLNQRLDAYWTYMESLHTRQEAHAIVIDGIDTRLERWSDNLIESLETIRDMLPKDEEPTSGDV